MKGPDAGPMDDLLVLDAQEGDLAALDALVQRWQKPFWSHAHRLTGDAEAAWDVTQEAWLGILKGLRTLHDPARFKSWAYRIVTNKAVDLLRSRRPTAPLEDASAVAALPHDDEVAILLSRLDPDKRVALVLFYIQDLSIAEIAAILRIPRGTVKSRLFHGRDALRALWRSA